MSAKNTQPANGRTPTYNFPACKIGTAVYNDDSTNCAVFNWLRLGEDHTPG
ncbi:MAG: hypothetical protein HF973_01225 [Chloroflexi bacterium]|nr:hypothetical protein [Chloroflexota bacterium]